MGDVVEAAKAFHKKRDKVTRQSLSKIKHKTLMDTHRDALIHDISLVFILEIQRRPLGDIIVDEFIDELRSYREFSAVRPHDFDDTNAIENIVLALSNRTSHLPIGKAFDQLTVRAMESHIHDGRKDVQYLRLLPQARNTSNGIALFQQWCTLDESQPTIELATTFGGFGQATATTQLLAEKFVDGHIKPSRSVISLNTQAAKAQFAKREKEHAFEGRCLARNICVIK